MTCVLPSCSSTVLTLTKLVLKRIPLKTSRHFSHSPFLQKDHKLTEILNKKNKRGKLQPVGIKKIESKKPVANVFDGICLERFAASIGKDIDFLIDVITQIASENKADAIISNPEAPLDRELILDVISYLKMRPVWRAPIVAIMGHVDHGKTTLLDSLRRSNIVAQEFGGITQHIGAFSVKLPSIGNLPVTFLDTPGHFAFKAMRQRGAQATDLVEAILLQSEIMQLCSTPKGLVEATIVESTNLPDLGLVCTAIINRGTLKKGTILVAGTCYGQVRTLSNEFDKFLDEAGPSTPVRISGWKDELPPPGELAFEVADLSKAKKIVEFRRQKKMDSMFVEDLKIIEKRKEEAREKYRQQRFELFKQGIIARAGHSPDAYTKPNEEEIAALEIPSLTIILRCDVDGALEALKNVLSTYNAKDQVRLKIANAGVGPLTEKDLELAADIGAYALSFNAPIHQYIRDLAKRKGVPLEEFHVIYKLVDRLKELLTQKITPIIERRLVGSGTVIRAYKLKDGQKKKQPVAGIKVDWGKMDRKFIWRFVRSGNAMAEQGVAITDKNVTYKEDDRVEETINPMECSSNYLDTSKKEEDKANSNYPGKFVILGTQSYNVVTTDGNKRIIEGKIRGVSYPLSAVSSTNKSLENTDMMQDTNNITEESKTLAKIFTEKLSKERSLEYPPGNLFFICKADTKLSGDSAGVAMVLAIMSLVLNKAIPSGN
uniref:Translation initiation factor IF-2 n=1 Tax=Meloidogyne javanica TaxID=6303 RepID=A0A915MFK9_MELJA